MNDFFTDEHGWKRIQMDFRHLEAFRRVHAEKNLTEAGIAMGTTRKSMAKMIQSLENHLGAKLFQEISRGRLEPTPFGERLHKDLWKLTSAQHRLLEQIRTIHESGRVLRVASSSAIFRTTPFRNLLRQIQSMDGLHVSFSCVDSLNPGRELISGRCDLYMGCWSSGSARFVDQEMREIPFRILMRKGRNPASEHGRKPPLGSAYSVVLGGTAANSADSSPPGMRWLPLPEKQWLDWIDNPDECEAGTLLHAPEWPFDPEYWEEHAPGSSAPGRNRLRACYLRQHPFEFLPSLVSRIRSFHQI